MEKNGINQNSIKQEISQLRKEKSDNLFDETVNSDEDIAFQRYDVNPEDQVFYKKILKRQKLLDIKGIEFDWIFNKPQGASFIKILAKSDDIELFSLKIVQLIIEFFWKYVRKAMIMWLLIPFLIYFTTFIIYATYFQKRKVELENGDFEEFGLANSLSIFLLLICIAYNIFHEIRQVKHEKWGYFINIWNIIDLVSLVLNIAIIICDLSDIDSQDLTTLMGIAVLFMWLKLFYFGRIFLSTAGIVRMILQITFDMRYFLVIFLLA